MKGTPADADFSIKRTPEGADFTNTIYNIYRMKGTPAGADFSIKGTHESADFTNKMYKTSIA